MQTLRRLESLLRAQREQKAGQFSEFLSLRKKLFKEVTSRVKERQRNGAPVSQPAGKAPGKLLRGLAERGWDPTRGPGLFAQEDVIPAPGEMVGSLQMPESESPLLGKQSGWGRMGRSGDRVSQGSRGDPELELVAGLNSSCSDLLRTLQLSSAPLHRF